MKTRRVREKNIRLSFTVASGAEDIRDFVCVSEAREAVDAAMVDWVIFEIDHPYYAARGRVLDSSDDEV